MEILKIKKQFGTKTISGWIFNLIVKLFNAPNQQYLFTKDDVSCCTNNLYYGLNSRLLKKKPISITDSTSYIKGGAFSGLLIKRAKLFNKWELQYVVNFIQYDFSEELIKAKDYNTYYDWDYEGEKVKDKSITFYFSPNLYLVDLPPLPDCSETECEITKAVFTQNIKPASKKELIKDFTWKDLMTKGDKIYYDLLLEKKLANPVTSEDVLNNISKLQTFQLKYGNK